MIETNKTYRIRTITGSSANNITIDASLLQDIESIDILSVSLKSIDSYRKHNANYGVIVGRVIANNGFGIPNAKISVFINADSSDGEIMRSIYPFDSSFAKDDNGVRYNLLPDNYVSDCHQVVGTFPNKRYLLDNDVLLEVFDKYYKFTAKTNRSGDYLICGVPTGNQTIHMDLDISDCGILSQRPRDFIYKGYNIEQFENANKFKEGTKYSELSQVFSQDRVVRVEPFWGTSENGETIGITRADIDVAFTFETTCVFMGSIGSDNASQGITEKCIPTRHMGDMDEMVTGEGTIEMIRKTPGGKIEEFQVKGNQLINADGVWCYQIPMNLDYVMTDEYGNLVPTDDPKKGIATRARVRFRLSMQDSENAKEDFYRPKILVPNNPDFKLDNEIDYDYEFGTSTKEESFRDLFWNNVYSVKSYIPRFQKHIWYKKFLKTDEFSGIKHCNIFGPNNPIPYNNIRIRTPFVFIFLCSIITAFIFLVKVTNNVIGRLYSLLKSMYDAKITILKKDIHFLRFPWMDKIIKGLNYVSISDGFCPDLEGWFFIPVGDGKNEDLLEQTRIKLAKDTKGEVYDDGEKLRTICTKTDTEYLTTCIDLNLANEYRVLNFDFYNDWINGFIYIPRVKHYHKLKSKFLGIPIGKNETKGCMTNFSVDEFWTNKRYLTQPCALGYNIEAKGILSTKIDTSDRFYHKSARDSKPMVRIFEDGGILYEHTTTLEQKVYYLKPSEIIKGHGKHRGKKINLYANDLILLGSLNDCDMYGIPQAYKSLKSTTYILPPNLPMTNLQDDTNQLFDVSTEECITYEKGADGIFEIYEKADLDKEGVNEGVAVTEISGIAWNIDGPNQRPTDIGDTYFNPGGHFLKMSCWQSLMQTKMKTCINLSRICEIGSSMSQKRLEPEKLIEENGKSKLAYINVSPTGLISNTEIIDTDARSMFATMNSGKLNATKYDENTRYKVYDFSYNRPNGFNGTAREIASKGGYNDIITIKDDTAYFSASTENKTYIDAAKTKTETNEATSVDYLKFRFGNSNLTKSYVADKIVGNNTYVGYIADNITYNFPIYENSFYFYFGLHQGSTALDEFNKNFFANCESRLIKDNDPIFELEVTAVTYEGNPHRVDIGGSAYTDNYPVYTIEARSENIPIPWNELSYTDSNGTTNTATIENSAVLEIEELPADNYNFILVYLDDNIIKKDLNLGEFITYNIESRDFIELTGGSYDTRIIYPSVNYSREINKGGYILLSDIKMPYLLNGSSDPFEVYVDIESSVFNELRISDERHRNVSEGADKKIYVNSEVDNEYYFFVPKDGEYYVRIHFSRTEPYKGYEFCYTIGPINIEKAMCKLYLNTDSGRRPIPQDAKFEWWKETDIVSQEIKEMFEPYVFDYRADEYKTQEPLSIPIETDNNNELVVWGFPQRVSSDGSTVEIRDSNYDFLLPSDSPEIPSGYEIDINNNYAGGNSTNRRYFIKKYANINIQVPDDSSNYFGYNGTTGIKGNVYFVTAFDRRNNIFWHNRVNNLIVKNTTSSSDVQCEDGNSNVEAYSKPYLRYKYPCVIHNGINNKIMQFPYPYDKVNAESDENPIYDAYIYPMFVCPIFNRPRKFTVELFDLFQKYTDFYYYLAKNGVANPSTSQASDVISDYIANETYESSIALIKTFIKKYENPKNDVLNLEVSNDYESFSKTYSISNSSNKWSQNISGSFYYKSPIILSDSDYVNYDVNFTDEELRLPITYDGYTSIVKDSANNRLLFKGNHGDNVKYYWLKSLFSPYVSDIFATYRPPIPSNCVDDCADEYKSNDYIIMDGTISNKSSVFCLAEMATQGGPQTLHTERCGYTYRLKLSGTKTYKDRDGEDYEVNISFEIDALECVVLSRTGFPSDIINKPLTYFMYYIKDWVRQYYEEQYHLQFNGKFIVSGAGGIYLESQSTSETNIYSGRTTGPNHQGQTVFVENNTGKFIINGYESLNYYILGNKFYNLSIGFGNAKFTFSTYPINDYWKINETLTKELSNGKYAVNTTLIDALWTVLWQVYGEPFGIKSYTPDTEISNLRINFLNYMEKSTVLGDEIAITNNTSAVVDNSDIYVFGVKDSTEGSEESLSKSQVSLIRIYKVE